MKKLFAHCSHVLCTESLLVQVLRVTSKLFFFLANLLPKVNLLAYRAADWNLDAPVWQGKTSVKAVGERCFIQLEDQNTGQVFAVCNVDMDKQLESVEPVLDSSRYKSCFLLQCYFCV